jgi:hypothetical protein
MLIMEHKHISTFLHVYHIQQWGINESGMVYKGTALKKMSPNIQKLICTTNVYKDQRLPLQIEIGQHKAQFT